MTNWILVKAWKRHCEEFASEVLGQEFHNQTLCKTNKNSLIAYRPTCWSWPRNLGSKKTLGWVLWHQRLWSKWNPRMKEYPGTVCQRNQTDHSAVWCAASWKVPHEAYNKALQLNWNNESHSGISQSLRWDPRNCRTYQRRIEFIYTSGSNSSKGGSHYPVHKSPSTWQLNSFNITYPVDSDFSVGWRYPTFEQLKPVCFNIYT